MNKKSIYIISGSVLLAAAIGISIYFYKKKKSVEKSTGKSDNNKQDNEFSLSEKNNTETKQSTTQVYTTSNKRPDQLSSEENVKRFQDWLDIYHPTWLKGGRLNKGEGYGNFGQNTKKAWDKYGDEYVNYTNKIKAVANKIIEIINNQKLTLPERAKKTIEILKNNGIKTKTEINYISEEINKNNPELWKYLTTEAKSFKQKYDEFINTLT